MIEEIKDINRAFQGALSQHLQLFHQVGLGYKRGEAQEQGGYRQKTPGDFVKPLHVWKVYVAKQRTEVGSVAACSVITAALSPDYPVFIYFLFFSCARRAGNAGLSENGAERRW